MSGCFVVNFFFFFISPVVAITIEIMWGEKSVLNIGIHLDWAKGWR